MAELKRRLARPASAAALLALALSRPAIAAPADQWSAYVTDASARFNVPSDWIMRVIAAESGGRTLVNGRPVVSRAGAMGLMQLMPATWKEMRSQLGLGPDPFDPRDNVLAGTAYLRAMYDRFGYPGLFAAYNAGPQRYAHSRSAGLRLPAETRTYMAKLAGPSDAPSSYSRASRATAGLFAVRTFLPGVKRDVPTGPSEGRLFAIRP
jgi:soluble lytic murein transglycosylase-like protein